MRDWLLEKAAREEENLRTEAGERDAKQREAAERDAKHKKRAARQKRKLEKYYQALEASSLASSAALPNLDAASVDVDDADVNYSASPQREASPPPRANPRARATEALPAAADDGFARGAAPPPDRGYDAADRGYDALARSAEPDFSRSAAPPADHAAFVPGANITYVDEPPPRKDIRYF